MQQHSVVVDGGGNEVVISGIFPLAVVAVDKQPPDPGVSHASGIAGQINASGEIPRTAQTGFENRKLIFAQLRCLVYGDNVVFLTLIAKDVAVGGAVAKVNCRSAGEVHTLVRLGVAYKRAVFREHRQQMI